MAPEHTPRKAIPLVEPVTAPFWEGGLTGRLLLQRCASCGAYRHPPSDICPKCLATDHAWVAASGKGTVYSFSIVRQALDKAWDADIPYCVAIVALEEGPHLLSNVTDVPVEDVAIGMSVEVFFERVGDAIALPQFRPTRAG